MSTYELVESDVELATLEAELVQIGVLRRLHCLLFLLVFIIRIDCFHLLVVAALLLNSHLLGTCCIGLLWL